MTKVVVLENIRSLHNVGSILRTADGAGFDQVYLCGYTGCPPDRRIEKVSLGAEEFVPWEHAESALDLCKKLKEEGFQILALEQTDKSQNILEYKSTEDKIDLAMVLGNEVAGVSPEVLEIAAQHLDIPMHGEKASLNVSIASFVSMYQLIKN